MKNAIISGKLPPKYHLVESDIAKALNVGRQTVRTALNLLERDRLVEIIPFKGAFVTVPSRQDVEEAFAVRIPLEALAARLAAEKADSDNVKTLEAIIDGESEAYSQKKRPQAYSEGLSFHLAVARLAGNRFLYHQINEIILYLDCFLILYDPFRADPPHSPRFHRIIVEHIKNKDGDSAALAMTEHIQDTLNSLDFSRVKLNSGELVGVLDVDVP